jgi:hypothetical protein
MRKQTFLFISNISSVPSLGPRKLIPICPLVVRCPSGETVLPVLPARMSPLTYDTVHRCCPDSFARAATPEYNWAARQTNIPPLYSRAGPLSGISRHFLGR